MNMPCHKTESYEFHSMAYWVFIEADGSIAHMPTKLIEYYCFECGKKWRSDLGTLKDVV